MGLLWEFVVQLSGVLVHTGAQGRKPRQLGSTYSLEAELKKKKYSSSLKPWQNIFKEKKVCFQ